ncbi:MAG: lysophospholipid acyltransferase family protein [Verrucomicrobia bacterium]|nr:lysophospholipid acyltransferase family protein [Verrucomicrobiota bacterium]
MKGKRYKLYTPQAFRAASAVARWLPGPGLRWLARRLADVNYLCLPRFRKVVRANLSRVVNGRQPLEPVVRQNFRNFAESLADYVCYENLRAEQLGDVLVENSGLERLEAGLARKRGVIVVTAHLGNWELGGLLCALRGYPIWAVTLEEEIDELTAMRENYRGIHGVHTIRIGKSPFAAVPIIHQLQQNSVVAMLIDRPPAESAQEVRFFGAPARFSAAPAVLAHLTGATVLPSFVVGVGQGRYRAFIEPPVAMDVGELSATVATNTQRLAAVFERVIAEHADQWYHFVPVWSSAWWTEAAQKR